MAYDGPALADGTFRVRDLAPALLAFADLVERLNRLTNGRDSAVEVKLRAEPRRGSFEIDLALIVSFWQQVRDLVLGDDAQALERLLAVLVGGGAAGAGVWKLIRAIGQQRVRRVEASGPRVVVILDDGSRLETADTTWRAAEDRTVRRMAVKVLAPLGQDGIDELALRDETGREGERLTREDLAVFRAAAAEDDPVLYESEHELVVTVVRPVLDESPGKWQVAYNGQRVYVAIEDEAFLRRVAQGQEAFAAGDRLRCQVRMRQRLRDGEARTEWIVLKVIDHEGPNRQPPLPALARPDDDLG